MLKLLGTRIFTNCPTVNGPRCMSWYVFNNLRDTSTISPKSRPKKRDSRSQKPYKPKSVPEPKWESKDWLIECKRQEYNLPKNVDPKTSSTTELASHAWHNRHSNGDHFTIHATAKPSNIQNTVSETFQDTHLSPELVAAINKLGYNNPTQAQWMSIEPLLKGKHTLIAAETGCGKTLAYLLPLIQQILEWKTLLPDKLNTPLGLVLTPNRELVKQIYDIADQLAATLPFTPFDLIGGKTKRKMRNADFDKMDLLIATPSVVSKLTSVKLLDMSCVRHVVLDEADTLLDDSFNWYIKRFLGKISVHANCKRIHGTAPEGAQITLASATMPQDIAPILSDFMDEDSFEKIKTPGLHKIMPQVTQTFMRMGKIHKPEKLLKFAKQFHALKTPTLIFCNKNSTSSFVTHFLNDQGVKCLCFNGNMPADIRYSTFQKFQSGEVNFLATTDIGSRGLNTIKAQVILNYDFPVYMADYLHRCGRVGRIGSVGNGKIINFVNGPAEIKNVQAVERSIRSQEPIENVEGNILKQIAEWYDDDEELNESRSGVKRMSN